MFPRIGAVEVVLLCFTGIFSIGLPVASLVFLYIIYNKLKIIEELLKKE